MTELTLKDKFAEITSVIKNLEGFLGKNPDMHATVDVIISYDGESYARLFNDTPTGELEFDILK